MRTDGTVVVWYDDKGFGFVREAHTMREFFFHISAYCHDGQRPQLGDKVRFGVLQGHGDRSIAVGVWQHKVKPGDEHIPSGKDSDKLPFPHARDELRKWLRITPHRIVVATAALAGVLYIVQQTLVLPETSPNNAHAGTVLEAEAKEWSKNLFKAEAKTLGAAQPHSSKDD